MLCPKCLCEIPDDSKVCPLCGAELEAEAVVVEAPAAKPSADNANVAKILGYVGLAASIVAFVIGNGLVAGLAFICSLVSLIMGLVAGNKKVTLPLVGMIIAAAVILLPIIIAIVLVVAITVGIVLWWIVGTILGIIGAVLYVVCYVVFLIIALILSMFGVV